MTKTEKQLRVELPKMVENCWAAAASGNHGTGYVGVPLEIYLCPKCGAHPSLVDSESGSTGMLCMSCGFGIRPIKNAAKSFERWNKAVEQYIKDVNDD